MLFRSVGWWDVAINDSLSNSPTLVNDTWTYFYISYPINPNNFVFLSGASVADVVSFNIRLTLAKNGEIFFKKAKIESGNKPTDWSPAPEDVASGISTAQSTADAAQTAANNAQSTAEDAWSRTLRVQVSSSPADATGDTSTLTATVWRGGQQLTEQEVAMMGLIKWYVGDSCKATGWTYTCAAGTATECRLEA